MAATRGSRSAGLAGLGIATGCFRWAVLVVALGLGALLAASQLAYTTLRWAAGRADL
jgi:threonine/homoserine/homoserine lactone efflux protein